MKKLILVSMLLSVSAFAETKTIELTITKDRKMTPEKIEAKAGDKIIFDVKNESPGTEEFEIKSLKVEKLIAKGKSAKVTVGPLKAGTYEYIGEFHQDTCKGTLEVK